MGGDLGRILVWVPPFAFLLLAGAAIHLRGRAFNLPELMGAGVIWAVVEGVNAVLPLWRYVLLPSPPVIRALWLVLFGGSASVLLLAVARRPGPRPGRNLLVGGVVVGGAVGLVGTLFPTGPRLNPASLPWSPGDLVGVSWVGLAVSGVLALGLLTGAAAVSSRVSRMGEAPRTPSLGAASDSPGVRRGRVCGFVGLLLAALAVAVAETASVASLDPGLRDLPGALPSELESLPLWGVPSVSALAERDPVGLSREVPNLGVDRAEDLVSAARLATYRGIGLPWVRVLWSQGIRSPEDLRGLSVEEVRAPLGSEGRPMPRRAWVRSWIE